MNLHRKLCDGPMLVVAVMLSFFTTCVSAQSTSNYPSRPVRMIVPYQPAGVNDIVARIVAQKLTEKWGQTVLVENRSGAAGNIGTELVAKAAPDGYTMLFGSTSNISMNVSLYEKLPFDPVRDFAPVGLVVTSPQVILVRPALKVNTLLEFVALAKSKPGALNYSTYGNGSLAHLSVELLQSAAGIDMVQVPYNGGGPAMTAVMAGEVEMTIVPISVSLAQIKAGTVRALAVLSSKRFSGLPDVPTTAEAGVPGFEADSWVALVAPAGTPPTIVRKVSEDMSSVLMTPEMKKYLEDRGMVPIGSSPEQLGAFIKREIDRWGKVIKATGVRAEQ